MKNSFVSHSPDRVRARLRAAALIATLLSACSDPPVGPVAPAGDSLSIRPAASAGSACTYSAVTPAEITVGAVGVSLQPITVTVEQRQPRDCVPVLVRLSPEVSWVVPLDGAAGRAGPGVRYVVVLPNTSLAQRVVTLEFYTVNSRGARAVVGRSRITQAGMPLVPRAITYGTFDNKQTLARYAWSGRRVAVLTARRDLDAGVMSKILLALDAAYDFYAEATGFTPGLNREVDGKLSIAEVPSTCGAGCGYLGQTGIELRSESWQQLYDGVAKRNEFDQVVFYELGRNFWRLGATLAYKSPDDEGSVTTGFAVLMRFLSMEAVGVRGGPFNGRGFSDFRREVESLVDVYERDRTATWATTLKVGRGVPNAMGLGATDLFASFVLRLARDNGGTAFVGRLWKAATVMPVATTSEGALQNFIRAASKAADRDLSGTFRDRWRWPVVP